MIDLGAFRERFTPEAARMLERAVAESERRRHFYLGSAHIFWAALKTDGALGSLVVMSILGREWPGQAQGAGPNTG